MNLVEFLTRNGYPVEMVLTVRMNKAQDRKLVKPIRAALSHALYALQRAGVGDVRLFLDARPEFPKGEMYMTVNRRIQWEEIE